MGYAQDHPSFLFQRVPAQTVPSINAFPWNLSEADARREQKAICVAATEITRPFCKKSTFRRVRMTIGVWTKQFSAKRPIVGSA